MAALATTTSHEPRATSQGTTAQSLLQVGTLLRLTDTVLAKPSFARACRRMADESKGKGKAPARSSGRDEEQDARSDQATRSNSTAQSLAAALRTTMASSQLSSVMQTIGASGKHDPQRFGSSSAERSGELRDWLVQDLRSSPTAADSTVESSRTGTFRSSASGVGEASAEAEKMFEHFQRGLMLNEGSSETAAKEELAQDTI